MVYTCCDCRTGGVELLTPNGKIKVINTLEKRLQSISEQVGGLFSTSCWLIFLWIAQNRRQKEVGMDPLPPPFGFYWDLFCTVNMLLCQFLVASVPVSLLVRYKAQRLALGLIMSSCSNRRKQLSHWIWQVTILRILSHGVWRNLITGKNCTVYR